MILASIKKVIFIVIFLFSSYSFSDVLSNYYRCVDTYEEYLSGIKKIGDVFVKGKEFHQEDEVLTKLDSYLNMPKECLHDDSIFYDKCESKYFFPVYYYSYVDDVISGARDLFIESNNYYNQLWPFLSIFYNHERFSTIYESLYVGNRYKKAENRLDFLKNKEQCLLSSVEKHEYKMKNR